MGTQEGRPNVRSILIVDDERAILMAFCKLFQSPHVRIDVAETLEEVRNCLQQRVYDVVIADLRLTGVLGEEGLDILRWIREHAPQTRTILMTGYGNPEIMERAYELGVAFYFEKPVAVQALEEALRALGVDVEVHE